MQSDDSQGFLKSLTLAQGILPPQYSGLALEGVPPPTIFSRRVPKLSNFQPTGRVTFFIE